MAYRVRDDRNRVIVIPTPPRRIVSLVPSDTETVFRLGCGARLVGRTDYCVEPVGEIEAIPRCGGTKDIDVEAVCALTPDLVLVNQEENSRAALEALAQRGLRVFVSFPRRVAEGVGHLARLARILGVEREPAVVALVRRGHLAVVDAQAASKRRESRAVFVPIWMEPLMTVSGDTYASDLLALAGARNVFADRERKYPLAADLGKVEPLPADNVGDRDTRYPRIAWSEVETRAPELILLPDEPHRFSEADAAAFAAQTTPAARAGRIRFCDGKDLFWHGARTVDAIGRVRALIADSHD